MKGKRVPLGYLAVESVGARNQPQSLNQKPLPPLYPEPLSTKAVGPTVSGVGLGFRI